MFKVFTNYIIIFIIYFIYIKCLYATLYNLYSVSNMDPFVLITIYEITFKILDFAVDILVILIILVYIIKLYK